MEYSINNLNLQIGDNYLAYAVNKSYSVNNNSLFYAYVNPSYYSYFYNVVRENMEWYDGYVSGFHNVQNGIFSTRIASALISGITNTIFGKGVRFKNVNKRVKNYEAINFLSNEWLDDSNFNDALKQAIEYSGAGGTSALKINQQYKKLWVEALRTDQFYYRTNAKGELTEINSLLKVYSSTGKDENDKRAYILTEHRFYKNVKISKPIVLSDGKVKWFSKYVKKPYVEYSVNYFKGQITNNLSTVVKQEHLNWVDVPMAIRKEINDDYTAIRVNEPMKLPFINLGVELILIDGVDTHIPLAHFGKSFLTDIRSYLVEYDLIQSYGIRDKYNGQGQVGVPKQLSTGDYTGQANNPYKDSKLNYELYPGDPNTQKPIITQFDLRINEWHAATDNCLKKMATAIGMSPKVIASYLIDFNQSISRTATEVQSDDDGAYLFSDRIRKYIEPSLNRFIKTVCLFYKMTSDIKIEFCANRTVDRKRLLDNVLEEYNAGMIDLRMALTKLNEEYSEEEIDALEERVKLRQNEIQTQNRILINTNGDYIE